MQRARDETTMRPAPTVLHVSWSRTTLRHALGHAQQLHRTKFQNKGLSSPLDNLQARLRQWKVFRRLFFLLHPKEERLPTEQGRHFWLRFQIFIFYIYI